MIFFLILATASFILRAIDKVNPINPRTVLPWITRLQSITWSCGSFLFSVSLFNDHFQHLSRFAMAVLVFSSGLGIQRIWLKDKIVSSV
jgi:hypothetical protein